MKDARRPISWVFYFVLLLFFLCPKTAWAINFCDTVVVEEGLTVEQYLNYAFELQQIANFDGCFKLCKKVLESNPHNCPAFSLIAHSYAIQQNWDSCLIFGNMALAADTSLGQVMYQDLRDAYENKEDWKNAAALSQKMLFQHPDNSLAKWDVSIIKEHFARRLFFAITLGILFIIAMLIFWAYHSPAKQELQFKSGSSPGLLEILFCTAFAGGVLYYIFVLIAPWAHAGNTRVPTQQLTSWFINYSYEHDGREGVILYAMTLVCIFSAYVFAIALSVIKNTLPRLTVVFTFAVVAYLFLLSIGFNIPVSEPAVHILPLMVITLSVITFLYLVVSFWWRIALGLCAVCLLPVCFIGLTPVSISDANYVLMPALRMMHGARLTDIYFQYDLLLSLTALIGLKLNMPYSFIQHAAQLSIYMLFLGLLLFSRKLFYNKNLAILLLAFLVVVRFYANLLDLMFALQITPIRLDLWFILLVLVYWKNLHHWSVGTALALMVIFHRNFGYIYLAVYLQLLFLLFLVDIGKKRDGIPWFHLILSNVKMHFARSGQNLILIAIGLIISGYLFGGLSSIAVSDYTSVGLGMLPVSMVSFYWYVPIVFGALPTLLLIYRKNLTNQYFVTGLFLVLLGVGNSIYFLGRSHENNLINISAVLGLALYLLFDVLIYVSRLTATGGAIKNKFRTALLFSLPFIAVLIVACGYGKRIDFKVKNQWKYLQKSEFIRPLDVEPDDFAIIKTLTHNSDSIYFFDTYNDFMNYYYGNYAPTGYFNPCAAYITKQAMAQFLQKLLDAHYCIVCRNHPLLDEFSGLLNYNRAVEKNRYIVIEKVDVKYLLKSDTNDVLHLAFNERLFPRGIKYGPVNINGAFIIQCILKPDSIQNEEATILENRFSTIGEKGFNIAQVPGQGNTFVFKYGDNNSWITSGHFKLTPGQLNLLTITMDNDNTLSIFINDVMLPVMAGLKPIKGSTMPLMIGNCFWPDRHFNGIIREVKIAKEEDGFSIKDEHARVAKYINSIR